MQEEDKSKRLLRSRHCPSYHSKAAAATTCRRRTAASGGSAGHPAHGGSALSAAAGRTGSDRLRLRHFDLVHLTDDLVNVDDVLVLVYEVLGREAGAVARVSPAQTHGRLEKKNGLLHFKSLLMV